MLPGSALGEAAELERADLLQVGDRLQVVLLGGRVRHRDHVGVEERRRLQHRVALLRLQLPCEHPGRVGRLRRELVMEDVLHDHAGVLGVEVDLAAREGGLDQLRRPDVLLVGDMEALRLERLLVQLTEDELLGEVLGADDHRRPHRRRGIGRPREGGRHQADHDRDPETDREGGLGGSPGVLADHCCSFPVGFIVTLVLRRPLGVTAVCARTSAKKTSAERTMTQNEAPRTPERR